MVGIFEYLLKFFEDGNVELVHIDKAFVTNISKKMCVEAGDENAYNVLVIGPTGSGKSLLINRIVNRYVFETGNSPDSVTQNVQIISGMGVINGREKKSILLTA